MRKASFAAISVTTLVLAGAALVGCPPSPATTDQAQPPVIVVQAPPDSTSETPAEYTGLGWEAVTAAPPAATPDPNDPKAEPYDVVALLREFDPDLNDAPKDQTSEAPTDDLLSALAVMDDTYLYGRLVTRAPMTGDAVQETRFWIEQGGKMVTVEIKSGSAGRPCEMADVATPEVQKVVPDCFWIGHALDFRIPLELVPPIINTAEPYWVSGFQTCCADEARNEPFDEIEGAQEVWRVPQQAAASGGDATPAPI